MLLKIASDPDGNKRVLLVIGIGPETSYRDAPHLFEVRLTDPDGKPVEDVPDPLAGPLPFDKAVTFAKQQAAKYGLRLAEDD